MSDYKMKKTNTRIVLGTGAILLAVGIVGQAVTAHAGDGGWTRGGHGGGHGGPHGMMRMFDRFDTNEDGKVTRAEIEALIGGRVTDFDKDGTAGLSEAEFTQLFVSMMKDRIERRFSRLDANDDGVIDAAELQKPATRMIRWIDEDGDDAVSIKEAKMAMEKRRHRGHR
jgi:hypothetical protein